MDKVEFLRQFISNYIAGPNADALIGALAEDAQKMDNLSVAVNDQLTISTSADIYLDKRLSEVGITRPPDLGMDDLSFQQMGIQINAAKQITQVIHTVLSTFYGEETVRAWTQSGQTEPYDLKDQQVLTVSFEDGIERNIIFRTTDFRNISQATAQEVADVITRYVRSIGLHGFAQTFQDSNTGLNYVRIFGGAQGPYSLVQVMGGEVQDTMEFPALRPTNLSPLPNNTIWEVTRTAGFTLRFRWVSGNKPALQEILVGDRAMMYGPGFVSNGLQGTFVVTNVRPPKTTTSLDAGWFEVNNPNVSELKSTPPDTAPQANTPGNIYSYTVTQTSYYDLKFFLAKKNTPYSVIRYALGFEPANDLLRIYIPATTKVVRRDLQGAAHVHMLYGETDLTGTYGSNTIASQRLILVNATAIKYPQVGKDNTGSGGIMDHGASSFDIDYVSREDGFSTVHLLEAHDLIGDIEWQSGDDYLIGDVVWYEGFLWTALANTGPSYGGSIKPATTQPQWKLGAASPNYSSEQITVSGMFLLTDDDANPFLGPYVFDPQAQYQLTDQTVNVREQIVGGQSRRTLFVEGVLPNKAAIAIMDLNKDTQEGPIPIVGAEGQSNPQPVTITSISQNGFQVIVKTAQPHQAIPGSQVLIAGTTSFNGILTVDSVPTSSIFIATSGISQTVAETTGTSTTQVNEKTTTIILDQSYQFKFNHDIGSDLTIISSSQPVVPAVNGSDYPLYVTGTADGRDFLTTLLQQITALGIKLEIIVVYPSDIGLGNQGGSGDANVKPVSDKVYVWGL